MEVSYYWKVFKNISISFWREDNVGMFVNNVSDIGQCRVIIIITIIIITLFTVMKSGAPLLGLAKYIYYHSMGKLYQTLVRKSLMGILFNFVLSNTLHTRNTHVLQLSADHQGDCFTSCKNIISTFILFRSSQTVLVTFPYLPCYWPWVHVSDNVQPEGVKLSPLCPEKIGFLSLVPGITDSKWD